MALFGKDRDREERPRAAEPAVAPAERAPREVEMFERDKTRADGDTGATSAFLGKGTRITGKLAFEGTVRIEGEVEGEIAAQDTLTIGEGALVKAKITGTSVIVQGQVTGDVNAKTRLELRAPSKVVGNINTPNLVIQEGAIFEGQCAMGGADGARKGGGKKPDFSVLVQRAEDHEDLLATPPPAPPK
jgi:cytoskeletal protein CcmA (bactofilin family)